MSSDTPVKETKAQKQERLKREKNPWEAFDEIRAFARDGRASVVPEWAATYFKWWGFIPRATEWAQSAARAARARPPSTS